MLNSYTVKTTRSTTVEVQKNGSNFKSTYFEKKIREITVASMIAVHAADVKVVKSVIVIIYQIYYIIGIVLYSY